MAISPLTFFWLDDPHDLQDMPAPNRNPGPSLVTYSLPSGLNGFCVSRAYESPFIGVGADGAWPSLQKGFPLPRLRGSSHAALVSWASR
jgi:hypothetical protein